MSNSMSIADLRREYTTHQLNESQVDRNPFVQFQRWFDDALRAQLHEPNALMLATVGSNGRPSARMMLLKGFDERGFVFFTNYASRKGQELAQQPWAAIVFFWAELERQVRIEGRCHTVEEDESDAYFQTRPRGNQIGALASVQSQVITSRELLEQRIAALDAEYAERPLPRPPHWGGYRLSPIEIEFWQGRPSRLHDRLRYRLEDKSLWVIERLSP